MTKRKLPVRFTGQHFTIDKTLISDSIRLASLKYSDTVLDIGAGKGFLTVHLLHHSGDVIAIEKDTGLASYLKHKYRHYTNLTILNIDFLNFRIPARPFKVVSNIPYGITSDILKILMFANLENFKGGSIVMQLAPARKLTSNKIYSPYAIFYRTFFHMKLQYEINPASFMPPPTVQSALLCIEPNGIRIEHVHKEKYLRFIQKLIAVPGTKTRTALKAIFRKSQIESICSKHSLDPGINVENVNPFLWKACFNEMLKVVPEKFHP
ncbi:rRNA adenine N-6-methyltransferase family protein [Parapedobacter deserti]|uniref:rRNA adenine N-6-methyltransferase family protein n=1 Tax=Parapedobacter deserti TaxID=1912957 RepID=A0ABV7JP15_9SPHI